MKNVLAIGAHPDDIEGTMGGTMFLLKQAGWNLHYLNLCDGCCGSVAEDAAATAARRLLEAEAACRLLGAVFYPPIAPDLQLYHTTENIAKVVSVIRRAAPDILLLQSPADYMEDHMNASRVGLTAAFARAMPNFPCTPHVAPIEKNVTIYHAMPVGHRDGLRRPVRPELYVDVSSAADIKRQMMACHASQKEWLDRSQGVDSYLDNMAKGDCMLGRMSGHFTAAEGWRRHLNIGYSSQEENPLADALGKLCWMDPTYQAELKF